MPNEIYHKSNWGNANAGGFGDVYFDAAATNKLYKRSDYYENSSETDKILRDLSNKASIVLTPTAYSDSSLNTVIPTDGNGEFDFTRGSSATRVNEQGLVESIASGLSRIDYTSGFGSLLLEPQSTNLITYSEDFSQWGVVNGAVVTDNFTTSPDGTQNAAKIVYDGTSSGRIELSTGASGTNTQSIYLKTASGTQAVSIGASSTDLTEVTVTSEWQRFTHTGSGSYPRVLCNDAATIYVWGAQLEADYATSYIPTNGSTVTRSADVANNSGNADLINSTEGVLYFEGSALDTTNDFEFGLYGDSITEQCRMVFQNGIVRAQLYNGAYQTLMSYTFDLTNNSKIAFKFKENDFALWINGTEVVTDNLGTTFSVDTLEKLNLANVGGTVKRMTANVKCVAVFKEALTDVELQQLTS
jgi:hypothetical protein